MSEDDEFRQLNTSFYYWVGMCVTRWGFIEDGLFALTHFALGTSMKIASIVFFRPPTIETRLRLTDELLRAVLPEKTRKNGGHDHPMVAEWAKIDHGITKLLKFRNFIAHQPVVFNSPPIRIQKGADGVNRVIDRGEGPGWFALYANHNEKLRGRPKEIADLKIEDLKDHYRSAEAVLKRLHAFVKALRQAQPEVSAAPTILPPKERTPPRSM